MLTFTSPSAGSLRITGASKTINVFPAKSAADDVNLVVSPQEEATPGVISWPGEYDVAGITVRGIGQEEGKQVSFMAEAEGYRCAFPACPLREWSEADIEKLGNIHVLCLPAQEPKICQQLIDEIDPRVLIILPPADGKMDNEVLKLAGAAGKEQVKEYKLKGALPVEGREVVVFQ